MSFEYSEKDKKLLRASLAQQSQPAPEPAPLRPLPPPLLQPPPPQAAQGRPVPGQQLVGPNAPPIPLPPPTIAFDGSQGPALPLPGAQLVPRAPFARPVSPQDELPPPGDLPSTPSPRAAPHPPPPSPPRHQPQPPWQPPPPLSELSLPEPRLEVPELKVPGAPPVEPARSYTPATRAHAEQLASLVSKMGFTEAARALKISPELLFRATGHANLESDEHEAIAGALSRSGEGGS